MILPPTAENIRLAGQALSRGELVGLPTETVYGIAVNAFDASAVAKVFELKGRPAQNPLIVHLTSVADVHRVALGVPDSAAALAERFWPGPLTLVLPRLREVPDRVTAGLDTVAVRIPSHPVARAVIEAAGLPLAAPSANRFMGLSPTRASDISMEIQGGLAMVLDGGPCDVGIESTVLDLSGSTPHLLRPGGVSRGEIEAIIGPVLVGEGERRSPGMYPRHYAPRARVVLVETASADSAALVFGPPRNAQQIQMPLDSAVYATKLYAALNELDRTPVVKIEVEKPPSDWEAVWDRLRKASTQ